MNEFPCSQCGKCCQNVHLAAQTRYLDRGDGTCRYFCVKTKLCSIYDARPDICDVQRQYHLNYKSELSWQQFVGLNLLACRELQEGDSSSE